MIAVSEVVKGSAAVRSYFISFLNVCKLLMKPTLFVFCFGLCLRVWMLNCLHRVCGKSRFWLSSVFTYLGGRFYCVVLILSVLCILYLCKNNLKRVPVWKLKRSWNRISVWLFGRWEVSSLKGIHIITFLDLSLHRCSPKKEVGDELTKWGHIRHLATIWNIKLT